jgi:LmbE family N-acetylglucosaminyl deacetylase
MERLGVLGRVLYLAAHPDDENTRLIAQWARGDLYDTAYLSLTRGGGGQNLIGTELRDGLGVIRTQELLAARAIDGGRQFFTRARDFGYSKNSAETFNIWDREELLGDVVWVIRKFQPDVVVTRFNTTEGVTHGHHTASAMLAVEAFEAAADPARFSEQLEQVDPWQVKRVVWNTSEWFFRGREAEYDASAWMPLEAGDYLPLHGEGPGEIAARSRSMHKSQGFGAGSRRGSATEYLDLLAGEPGSTLFDGIDTTWTRLTAEPELNAAARAMVDDFSPREPWKSVPALLDFRKMVTSLESSLWRDQKLREIDQLLAGCLALHFQAEVPSTEWHPGMDQSLSVEALNRSPLEVELHEVRLPVSGETFPLEAAALGYNQPVTKEWTVSLPAETAFSQPYWLREAGTTGFYHDPGPQLRGLPENPPAFPVEFVVAVDGQKLAFSVPTVSRRVDPVDGEVLTPVTVSPPLFVRFTDPVILFPQRKEVSIEVEVGAVTRGAEAEVALEMPPGWSVRPASQKVSLDRGESVERLNFVITPPVTTNSATIRATVTSGGQTYDAGRQEIDYPHIPPQLLFPPAETRAVRLELDRGGVHQIGYLPGAGDLVAESLRSVGYEVTLLDPANLTLDQLRAMDAVVIGIRAYNTIDEIGALMPLLFDYVVEGGTVIAQYNTSHRLNTDQLAPYPLSLSRDRVTDENATVHLLAPDHPALNAPNKITVEDFEGWVQERGLYFPNRWDDAFTPLIASADAGEEPLAGGLLVARHGGGHFVYTGYSWFRQLPAGVPGAYRLFVNLLALSVTDE